MLSGSAREATTRQQKQLNKFSCLLNRELRYNCSIARSELFTSCGRFRGGFRPSRPHGKNVLGCGASLWIAPSAAPHTSLVGGMTEITGHWLGRLAMLQHCCCSCCVVLLLLLLFLLLCFVCRFVVVSMLFLCCGCCCLLFRRCCCRRLVVVVVRWFVSFVLFRCCIVVSVVTLLLLFRCCV